MDQLTKDTMRACEQYGAFTVRKAALLYQKGVQALERVGLNGYSTMNGYSTIYAAVLDISNMAFDRMNDAEKEEDFVDFINKNEK
jgi:hypothetical protein